MNARGFVASGALEPAQIAAEARRAERLGYTTFWITVLAGRTDPVGVLAHTLAQTDTIEVGLGLVPLSAFGGAAVADGVLDSGADPARAIVALGVGPPAPGAAALWQREARAFRERAPRLRLAVGGYGPRVLAAGGRLADAVLLNWMTPQRLDWSVAHVDGAARAAGRRRPRPVYLYVSAATGEDGPQRIDSALAAFAAYDYHRRHQEAMAAEELVGVAASSRAEAEAGLARYGNAIPVVNPVGARDADERAAVLELFAPRGE